MPRQFVQLAQQQMAEETKPARRAISEEEVAKHNTEKDCWLIVHDLILKLGDEFLSEHPGGPDVITCLAGKDATNDFEDIAHSDSARDWTNKFIIGYKEGADETALTKSIPKTSELHGGGGGGGGGMGFIVPALVAALSVAAYLLFKAK